MNGLPPNFDATVFVGKDLIQVSFSQNNVHLSFDEDVSITVESSLVYRASAKDAETKHAIPVASSDAMRLLGKAVLRAEGKSDGTLKLEFEGGGSITCVDDSDQYESYHIVIGDKQIDV